MLFKDRKEAGLRLAQSLLKYKNNPDVIVLALPRGGVALGFEISRALAIPLDVLLVRKLGVPWQDELAFGAIAVGNVLIFNESIVANLNLSQESINRIIAKESQELQRRNLVYRQGRDFPPLAHKTVILVDDGIATGATMVAAIKAVRLSNPSKIIVASPLASVNVFQDMADQDVELLILETPEPFYGIGMWYGDFPQLTDNEVIELLQSA